MLKTLDTNALKMPPKAADAKPGGAADKKDAAKEPPNGGTAKNPDVGDYNPVTKKAAASVDEKKSAPKKTAWELGCLMFEDISKKEPKKDERWPMSGIE